VEPVQTRLKVELRDHDNKGHARQGIDRHRKAADRLALEGGQVPDILSTMQRSQQFHGLFVRVVQSDAQHLGRVRKR